MAVGARWSKTKDSLAGDKRYKALARDQREQIFRQYVAEQEVCTAAVTLWRSWHAREARHILSIMSPDLQKAWPFLSTSLTYDEACSFGSYIILFCIRKQIR